jgi:hypothetical protein
MVEAELIPDGDSVHRLIDFPVMYNESKGMLCEAVFQFPKGLSESVIWRKYAPTTEDVHRIGCEREATKHQTKPKTRYVGFISAVARAIRGIRTRHGHGFALSHEPEEGVYHAAISYRPADDRPLSKNEKNELKLALRKVFGELASYSGA